MELAADRSPRRSTGTPVLHVDGLSFGYGRTRSILTDVSLELNAGVTAILGANGAGKTSLLRLLCGIVRPGRGAIHRDKDLAFGYLPQSPLPSRLLTAEQYVAYAGLLTGQDRRGVEERARLALERVGMGESARTRTSRLSGGSFRRVCLAGALVGEPDVLVLDEPTAGLDPVQRVAFRRLVAELAGTIHTVVFATHLVEDAADLADRVLVLNGSRIVFDGQVDALRRLAAPSAKGSADDLERALVGLILGQPDDPAQT